ncbi:MAG: pyridoxine 5'-phosphate synthase [Rickettsiales bacterium]|nr:pyridoxine 5'-phosphate synthase [Rickettsiales bacterium]
MLRLGVNIDHVATLRNARGGVHPCPVAAALLAEQAGADGITAHLREDRRHIRDEDMRRLKAELKIPLNFEMAATDEMQKIALEVMPHAVCLVPEKREEVTTEGGLDVVGQQARLAEYIQPFIQAGIRVSMFVDPSASQLRASIEMGAPVVELHTGAYAEGVAGELERLTKAAQLASELGLECHAGHGLRFDNVQAIARLPEVMELNIGHFLMGEAITMGLPAAIAQMRKLMNEVHA